jgi:hypothetical protein
MEIGIIAVIFATVGLGVVQLVEVTKKDVPKPLIWLVVAFTAAISLYR